MPRPKIRAAKFGDVPAIHAALKEAHERSSLSMHGMDDKAAKALIMNAIQRHGGTTAGSSFVAVADNGEGIEGFIIGILQPLYQVLDVLEATDLFWIAREGADASTAVRLVSAMHIWATKAPKLALIRQGNSDIITDPARSGRILQRRGMRKAGHIYEKGIDQ